MATKGGEATRFGAAEPSDNRSATRDGAAHIYRVPARGTNRTGRIWRVVTAPSIALSRRPTGIGGGAARNRSNFVDHRLPGRGTGILRQRRSGRHCGQEEHQRLPLRFSIAADRGFRLKGMALGGQWRPPVFFIGSDKDVDLYIASAVEWARKNEGFRCGGHAG